LENSGMPDANYDPDFVRPDRTHAQLFTMALLRIAVGWHFAYEGFAKLVDPQWSAEGYLRSANWIAAGLFHRLAENPDTVGDHEPGEYVGPAGDRGGVDVGLCHARGGDSGHVSAGTLLLGSSAAVYHGGWCCRGQLSDREQERGRDVGLAGGSHVLSRPFGIGPLPAAGLELADPPPGSMASRLASRAQRAGFGAGY
jgi:uncharacterized membrane protein YphA (DoxX/SURF4 family)